VPKTFKIEVTYLEFRTILTALFAFLGPGATDLVMKIRSQDPANDGPEVEIIGRKP
jgi:hypothetical protein